MQYELFYLVGEAKEPELSKIKDTVKKIVEKEGGDWLEPEITEKRKMAYEIKGQFRGTYVARRFEIPEKDSEKYKEEVVQSITKQMNLNQDILRFITVKAAELPELKARKEIAGEKKIEQPKEKNEEIKKGKKTIDDKLEEILNI